MNSKEKQLIKTFKEQTKNICEKILVLLKDKEKLYYETLIGFEDPKTGSRALSIILYEIQSEFEAQNIQSMLDDLNEFDQENFEL